MILTLSSSSEQFSVSLFTEKNELIADYCGKEKKLQQSGLVTVENLLKTCGATVEKLSAICVDTGPGGYTSLRIGVAMAKTLAYALKIPVYEACSLDLIRANHHSASFIAAIDGKQGRLFVRIFYPDGQVSPVHDIIPEQLSHLIKEQNLNAYACGGSGFQKYPELLPGVKTIQAELSWPFSKKIPEVKTGPVPISELNVRYYRKSQAEELFKG